jgi:serine phosphatase RsbU (regulator of sigma subunit)/anti-anti-sigma regulatory factor
VPKRCKGEAVLVRRRVLGGNREASVVLVVDDDPVVRTLVRGALVRMKVGRVLEAADGEEARALLDQEAVDLVITDLLMPRLDGLGLIRWAREASLTADWIILSAMETFDAAVEAIQLGAFDFITKPPRLEALELAVRNVLEQRKLLRERERLFSELEETSRQLAAKVRELEEKSEALRRDLERAEVIQRALLPREPPPIPGWSVNALYRPGRYVGGDLYHVARVGEDHLALYVADATGHGVSSAMMSVLFHRRLGLTDESGRPLRPASILAQVNRALCEDRPGPGVFLTASLCLVDLRRGEAVLAAAGHPPALLRTHDGTVHHLERTGPALGLVSDARYQEARVTLEPGDRLLLFTDGLLQAANGSDPWTRFHSVLAGEHEDGSALLQELIRRVTAEDRGNGSGAERDDLTALLLEAAPGPSRFDNRPGVKIKERRIPTPTGKPVLWYGEDAERSYLEVRGRGTWTEADAFHETAEGLLDTGRRLAVLLSECEHLDSTFLGTIHELVSRHDAEGDASMELVGVTPAVRHEFEELGMERVLRAASDAPVERPAEMQPLSAERGPASDSRLRVLRAHEALAALSARNQERFLAVVETLRSELGDGER